MSASVTLLLKDNGNVDVNSLRRIFGFCEKKKRKKKKKVIALATGIATEAADQKQ